MPGALNATAYVLHIELRDLKPKIWREVWVPPGITLCKLHAVIQAAMGWKNAHLHGFAVPGTGRQGRYWGVPPEDCGGPPGFADLVQAWHDPADPEHANVREWLADMGMAGEPGMLDAAGWAALRQAVARLQPRQRAARTVPSRTKGSE